MKKVRLKSSLAGLFLISGLVCSALMSFNVSAAPNPEPYMVKDINPSGDSNVGWLIEINDTLFFAADDGVHGTELWKSNGATGDAVMVKDINLDGGSWPYMLTEFNGYLYFEADDGVHGQELWKSDGTVEGTVMVKDINIEGNGVQRILLATDSALFFMAMDNFTNGQELWKTDGTADGTVMVKDIWPGGGGSSIEMAVNLNGVLYFKAHYSMDNFNAGALWKSDGTADGTVMVKDLSISTYLTVIGDMIYMYADDGITGYELWKSDGTTEGTMMVKDINPDGGSWPGNLTNVNGTIFFSADDGTNGQELWKTDGTAEGTVMVKDINPDGSSGLGSLKAFNDILFFTADDGINGYEFWKSDGTAEGTIMINDLYPGTYEEEGETYPNYSEPGLFVELNNTLYFSAYDDNGEELWKSDGTAEGTIMIKDLYPGTYEEEGEIYPNDSHPTELLSFNGALYFAATTEMYGRELWAYNPSATSTDDTPPAFTNLPNLTTPINLEAGQVVTTNPYVINVKPDDNIDVAYVEFYVDGVLICTDNTADINGVYSCDWDTSKYHSDIRVIAYDTTGNQSVALERSVTVNLGDTLPDTGISAWIYLLGLLPILGIVVSRRFWQNK